METASSPPRRFRPHLAVAGAVVLLSATVITGWLASVRGLVTLIPGSNPMVMNMAVCVLLGAGALLALDWGKATLAGLCGAVLVVVGSAALTQQLSGISLGIDQLLWSHQFFVPGSSPGRMSPNAALGVALLGIALLMLARGRRSHWLLPTLVGVVVAFALLPLLSYLTARLIPGGEAMYRGMSFPSSVGLLLLAVGVLSLLRPGRERGTLPLSFMAAAFGMLIALGVLSIQSNQELLEANRLVVETYAVRGEIDHFVEEVARMESSARAYALTGKEFFRQRAGEHQVEITSRFAAMELLVAGRSEQAMRITRLRELMAQKALQNAELMRRRDTSAADAAEYLAALPTTVTSALVRLADEVRAAETRRLEEQEIRRQGVQLSTRFIQGVGTVFALGLLSVAVVLARRESAARRAAEARVAEVSRLQRAVLDGTSFGIVSTDQHGVITTFSRGAETMFGYTREELVGLSTPERFHIKAEVVARAVEITARTGRPTVPGFEMFVAEARTGKVDQQKWNFVRKDGTHFPARLTLTALRDEAGAITGFLGVTEDLTAESETAAALHQVEDRLQRVLGHADCLVWEAAVSLSAWEWKFTVHPSGLFHRLMGEKLSDPARLWESFEMPERAANAQRCQEALRSGAPGYGQEFRLIKNGRLTWVRESVAIVRHDQDQDHFWLVGVVTDITRVREMTDRLEQSEQRFRNAFDHAGIGMALVGLDGRWLQVNRIVCQVFGYEEKELMAKTFQDITHPDDLNADLAHLQDLLQGRSDHYHMEKRYLHRAGHLVYASLTVSLVRDHVGAPVHFISQIEDITQAKENLANLAAARDEALAASRLKSEFLANMSHEIRTPMNGVLGMVDLLMDSPLNPEQQQMGQVIQRSGRNLLTVIDDILDFSKIEAGKLTIEAQDFDLGEQLDQALALLSPRAQARGLTLRGELPPGGLPRLHGDAGRLQQVLVNLMGNAVKFTETGGVVLGLKWLEPARPGTRSFRLEVRDTGIGISAAEKARLFQAFTQADGSTTRRFGGTGLGLAISRQLVELMNGRIGVDSEPGRGSVFWFELDLPEAQSAAPVKTVAKVRSAPAGSAKVHLLVAEDNPANQLVIQLVLKKLGISSDLVPNGREAIARLAQGGYGAVLMDCQMPELDGYEATRLIRAGAAGEAQARIPVFALTAHAMASDREKCLAAGMDDYLSKPIRIEVLQQLFQRFGLMAAGGSVPPMPVAPAPAVLDPAQLNELRGLPGQHHPTLLEDLVELSLQNLPEGIARLHALATESVGAELGQLAHRLAGSVANFGAGQLRAVLRDLEQAAAAKDAAAVARLRPELDRQWHLVRDALSKLLNNPVP